MSTLSAVCIHTSTSFLPYFLSTYVHMIPNCISPLTYPWCACRGFPLTFMSCSLTFMWCSLTFMSSPLTVMSCTDFFFIFCFFFILAGRMQGVGVYEKQNKKKCRLTVRHDSQSGLISPICRSVSVSSARLYWNQRRIGDTLLYGIRSTLEDCKLRVGLLVYERDDPD